MARYDAMEDLVYGWVRRNAPHVTREAVDALIDGTTDILRDSMADAIFATLPIDHKHNYRPTLSGDTYALVEGR